MLLFFNRPDHHRYVEFIDGQFITIHQTKASSRLATQEDKQRFDDYTDQATNEAGGKKTQEEPQTFFEEKLPPTMKKGVTFLFLVFLFGMAFIIFELSNLFLSDTRAYLSTEQIPIIEQLEQWLVLKEEDPGVIKSESPEVILTDLTQSLHIHHSINEAYESSKTIVKSYTSTRITIGERNQKLSTLLTEMKQLAEYNETRLDERKDSQSIKIYEANKKRLTHFIATIEILLDTPYRGLSLENLNEGILTDQPLFEEQVQAFKEVLDFNQIPYKETDGKLQFSFEGI